MRRRTVDGEKERKKDGSEVKKKKGEVERGRGESTYGEKKGSKDKRERQKI